MTMSEVLEGIRGLGERFDTHAKRLAALERETGMADPDDDDDDRNYRSKTELALEMLERVLELGYLRAEWVAGDDAFDDDKDRRH